MTVDIVGIGNHQLDYPEAKDENFEASFEEYLTIAKKTIRTFANRFRPGLANEMLNSEDAISNVATAIMMADWRWSPEYRSDDGKVRSKRSYRNQCAIWAIQAYVGRRVNEKKMVSLDMQVTQSDNGGEMLLRDVIPSGEKRPDTLLIEQEDHTMLQKLITSSVLTDQQKDYINRYYLENMTLQQIADDAGSSREAVRQTIERGMNKIKRLGEVYEKA